MENITISPTKKSFGIICNGEKGTIDITGISYPENAIEFFNPVLDWVKQFIENKNMPLLIRFKVNYYNTSSSKYLFKMLEILERYYNKGNEVEVKWSNSEGEEDMLESWREMMDEFKLPYNIEMD